MALGGFALGLTLLSLSARPLWAADDAHSESAEQRKMRAKAKYEQGVERYRSERYADAAQLFLEADALSPSAALSFNIARAYEKLGDDAATLRWYRNYLRLNPAAPNAAEVEQSVQMLSLSLAKKGVVQLSVLSSPSAATVAIDGQALGVTPLTLELKPGVHHALLTLRGFSDAQRDFTLDAGVALDLPIELTPAPVTEPLSAPTDGARVGQRPAHEAGRRFGVAPWITLGAGAVALGSSLIFEESRRSAQDAAQHDQTQLAFQTDVDAMNQRQTNARVLLGVGGVLVATGATLLVIDARLAAKSAASVSTLPGGAALSFRRSF